MTKLQWQRMSHCVLVDAANASRHQITLRGEREGNPTTEILPEISVTTVAH